jgi:hypothetical protein
LRDTVSTAVEQARSLEQREHRPWPAPERPWLMGQSWLDLLFAHWPVRLDDLRPHVPDALGIDTWDGDGWLGTTPFRITGLRLRGLPPLPVVSSFDELNVRTYVTAGGKSGIWFFSLDASSVLAVLAARRLFALPYFRARIAFEQGAELEVDARRLGERARFHGSYRPVGAPREAQPGSLEHFLTERYCLYSLRDGELLRAEIHHRPWPLQAAEGEVEHEHLVPAGARLGSDAPLLHFSRRQDVVVWSPEPAGAATASGR